MSKLSTFQLEYIVDRKRGAKMNQKRFLLILLIIVGALALNACVPATTGGDASSAIVPTATSEALLACTRSVACSLTTH